MRSSQAQPDVVLIKGIHPWQVCTQPSSWRLDGKDFIYTVAHRRDLFEKLAAYLWRRTKTRSKTTRTKTRARIRTDLDWILLKELCLFEEIFVSNNFNLKLKDDEVDVVAPPELRQWGGYIVHLLQLAYTIRRSVSGCNKCNRGRPTWSKIVDGRSTQTLRSVSLFYRILQLSKLSESIFKLDLNSSFLIFNNKNVWQLSQFYNNMRFYLLNIASFV